MAGHGRGAWERSEGPAAARATGGGPRGVRGRAGREQVTVRGVEVAQTRLGGPWCGASASSGTLVRARRSRGTATGTAARVGARARWASSAALS